MYKITPEIITINNDISTLCGYLVIQFLRYTDRQEKYKVTDK